MRGLLRLLAGFATALSVLITATGIANADTADQPPGSVPVPDGPAPAWIIADMDTGQVLAGRDMYAPHPPASTIKTLLALVVLDEVPNLDTTVVASNPNTLVECNCAGVRPGRIYTARQLLDGLLLVSGNDAANTLADMVGGYQAAVDKMNAKAVTVGATNTHATTPSGLDGPDGPGWTTPHPTRAAVQPKAATSIFFIWSIRWYPSGVASISSRRLAGTTCQLTPNRSTHQPHCSACGTALSRSQYRSISAWSLA